MVRYELWLGGVRVTSENKDDVFGDGSASFDPDTKTLTLNEPAITDVYTDGDGSSTVQLAELRLPCAPLIPADLNFDGNVNVTNVTVLLDRLSSTGSYNDVLFDLNGDGDVTVSDVTWLLDRLTTVE